MSHLLRGLGLLIVLGGVVLLLVGEKGSPPLPVPPVSLIGIGVLVLGGGIVLSLVEKAGRAVSRRRCVRCNAPVQPGEVYCSTHFREAIDRIRDSEKS